MSHVPLDAQDQAIFDRRAWAFWDAWTMALPRVGDFIDFTDGVTRRVSHVWDWPAGQESVQTSEGGSFYLGEGYCSFSGGLFPAIPTATLTLTHEVRDGAVWFFHHDQMRAHGGVFTRLACAVFTCTLTSHERSEPASLVSGDERGLKQPIALPRPMAQ